MSTPNPFGGGVNPFEGLFANLQNLLAAKGPVNWDIAQQMAMFLATEGKPEANVDPLQRIRLEELSRVADLHVADATGLATSTTGGLVRVRPVTRGEWATRSLDAWKPLLERLTPLTQLGPDEAAPADEGDPLSSFLANFAPLLGPMLLGMQAGLMVGHLTTRTFGQYDLPIPRPPSDELVLVSTNVTAFAEDWSLATDDLWLWLCLSELTHHAVLGRPHVRERLNRLLGEYVAGFRPDPSALELDLGSIDPSDPAALQRTLGNPEVILGAAETPEQRQIGVQIAALVAAIEGYVDHVMDTVGRRLVSSAPLLEEAIRRRRVEASEGDRFVERVFGLELGQAQYDRGEAFVRGVVERAGEAGLNRLWRSARELPTPSEVDAPGLWLERIDLPNQTGPDDRTGPADQTPPDDQPRPD